ncbi:hypothetical protein B0H14DRAFT_2559622 [Mycena olivaceomarginata]|nr:hypothetical protein B0H14DRAFT_2559622 [Mycena olivaceomarginata]
MPHPLREKAHGRPIFRLRIMPRSDDVSGNYFIRVASTSLHASSSEQFALSEDCVPGIWHEAYNCELEQEILFEIIPHALPADNPQQSETSSHIGIGGSLLCRRDLADGTKEYRETDEGYQALYRPGIPRQTDSTIEVIRWQVWTACLGNESALGHQRQDFAILDLTTAGKGEDRTTRDPELNKDSYKGDERTALKMKIKRRIQKELWDWVVQQRNEFILLPENDPLRLGLDLKAGIHYNVLLNTRGIDPHRDTPGEIPHTYLLGNDKYVWHDTTKTWDDKKADIFATRLQACSVDCLSIPPPRPHYVVQNKNSLIGKHFKMLQQLGIFHLHELCSPLLFDLWKATGVFSGLRIFLNHQSPSHDIAFTLADMERFKHMRRLGWTEKSQLQSGTVKLNSAVKRAPVLWNLTLPEPLPIGSTWVECKYVVAQAGDSCKPGFWVFVRKAEIMARDGSALTQHNTIVIVDPFTVLDIKDTRFNMPILVPSPDTTPLAVKTKFFPGHLQLPFLTSKIVLPATNGLRHNFAKRDLQNVPRFKPKRAKKYETEAGIGHCPG